MRDVKIIHGKSTKFGQKYASHHSHAPFLVYAPTHLTLVPLEVAVLAARGLGDAVGEVAPGPRALAGHGVAVGLQQGRGEVLDALTLAVGAGSGGKRR